MTDQAEVLDGFLDFQFGDTEGQVYLATLTGGGQFKQYMIDWPRRKPQIIKFALTRSASGDDVYYGPALFHTKEDSVELTGAGATAAKRENVKGSHSLWADFDDGSAPENWEQYAKEKGIPVPSLIVESSVKGNQHVYWHTEWNDSVERIEQLNRTIALACGADRSGWDANQLLRLPGTLNHGWRKPGVHKSWYKGQPVEARISGEVSFRDIRLAEFSALASPEREALERLSVGDDLPRIEEVLALAKWSKELYAQFSMTTEEATESSPHKRSGALQKLAYDAAESGLSDEQILTVLYDADTRWEKYSRRAPGLRRKLLLDTIARARAKVGYLTEEHLDFAGILGTGTQATDIPKLAYGWEEFLATELNIEWLVEDLMAITGTGILTGQPGTGKTQLGINISAKLALGHANILGWHNVGGPKKVVMMSHEMSHAPLKHFVQRIDREYSGENRQLIQRNFTIVPLGKPIAIDRPEGLSFYKSVLSEFQPDVLFIDSLQRVSSKPLTDEIAAKELMDTIDSLKAEHNCAVMLIHHDRKRGSDPTKQGPGELSDMYGSQYLSANVDWVLSLRKTKDAGLLVVETWKNRLAEERKAFKIHRNVNLQFDEIEEVEDGDLDIARRIVGASGGDSGSGDSSGDEGGTPITI